MSSLGMTRIGSLWWVQVMGSLTQNDLRQLSTLTSRLGTHPPSKILLDFSEVRHLDFRGSHFLLATCRLVRLRGGEMQMTGVSDYLWDLLRLGVAQEVDELITNPKPAPDRNSSQTPTLQEPLLRACPTMVQLGMGYSMPLPSPN
ncbi:MAG: STAS domain-containing protein [Candidatus Eisenbacteria bacterium]|uniref:STAS domain-containing protein n=1 Tax=Eiseniibacteriota bacterium TaxID=2212470 RepID=A0A948S382_UNCEI|nr:STAS domain-containing protein [Candidatus Eisenbacteria bacterium]MBU1950405.1 STAS domain-containing protein [Candidatus Eisenbacteria bacterium]MBU2692974.1 STAS domain-containing protein [Candidatus Eisenbacteria bacterium]